MKLFNSIFKRENETAKLKKQLEKAVSKMPADIVEAHSHSSHHRQEVESSRLCGCFYCLETFSPKEITEWVDNDDCAICPKCGIDSVIGDAAGYPLNKEFLAKMHKYWFED